MKKLIAYYGDSPAYVEGFPADCVRTKEGALHILPGKAVTVSDDEFRHIQEKYSWMKPKLKVIAEIKEGVKPAEVSTTADAGKPATQPSAPAPTPSEPEKKVASTDDGGKKGLKGRTV
jgi:hypothetical protein